jgi:hypothetical protein
MPQFTKEFIKNILLMKDCLKPYLEVGKQKFFYCTDTTGYNLFDIEGNRYFSCSSKDIFFKKIDSIAKEMGIVRSNNSSRVITVNMSIALQISAADTTPTKQVIDTLSSDICCLNNVYSVSINTKDTVEKVL